MRYAAQAKIHFPGIRDARGAAAGWVITTLLVLLTFTACSKHEPPPPVEVGQIPALLEQTFKGVKDPTASLVKELVAAVEQKEWPKASVGAQALSAAAGITAKQREAVGRCLIAINQQVNEAAEAGNTQAEEVRRMIRQDK